MIWLRIFLVLVLSIEGACAGGEAWQFKSVRGGRVEPFASKKTKLLVVVFITTDCPVANYFQPTLRRLQGKHAEAGVEFVLFHSDPAVTIEAAVAHADEYGITVPVALDSEFVFAKRLKAEVTPEAFVIARGGDVKYRGRINDMYTDFGKKRRAPRTHDLDDAIGAALEGKEISSPRTKPIGCYIPYPKATTPSE